MYKLKKENISGISPIIIENAEKDNMLLNIEGDSYQSTREGYNLFDYLNKVENGGGLTYTLDKETGYIIVNGTPEWDYTTCVKSFEINDLLEDGKTYSIWQEVYSDTRIGGLYCQVAIKHKTDGNIQYINSSQSRVNFIVDKNQYNYNMMLQIGTIAIAGTFNNYKNRYMLYEGTDNKTFELYGSSPTLENPSEVESVGDNINLYPFESIEFQSNTPTESWCYIDGKVGAYGNTVTDKTDYKITLEKGKYYFKLETDDSNIITGGLVANDTNSDKQLTLFDNAFEITETTVCTLRLKVANPSLGINIKSIKLEKGTVSTPYSQYGQGSIEIVKSNKNILDWLDLLNKIGITLPYTKEVSGITFEIDEKGTISVKGTSTSTISLYLTGSYTSKTVKYVINNAKDTIASGFNNNWSKGLSCVFLDNSGDTNIHLDFCDSTNNKCTKDKFNVTALMFALNSGVTIDETYNLMLEKGTITTDFIEHKGDEYVLPIQKPFYKIGNYKDNFIKQNNVWYEQHFIKELVLTGEENFNVSSIKNTRMTLKLKDIVVQNADEVLAMSNSFLGKTYNETQQSDLTNVISINNGYLSIDTDNITDTSTFKAKLKELYDAGTPVKVYYVLATPKLIECTEEQSDILNNLETFDGQNIITVDTFNNTNPNILINYTPKMIDEIKEAFTKNITKAYVIRTRDGFEINQDNYLKDYKLEELRFVPDNGFIGGTVARRLTLDFNNVDNQFDIQDEDLRFFAGVEYEGKDYYIDYGNFIVQKPETENTTDNTNATCLDYMCLLNATYNDEMTYPCTLGELAENVCSQAGLELATKTFRNSDFIVTDNQFVNNEPLRTVLGAIALSAFSWARIGQDNRVYIDFTIKQQEDISLDYDSYFNLSMASKPFGPINRIILRNSQVEGENITVQDDESIAENGVHELVIADNPFAYTQEKREQLIEAGKEFYGFTYMPITSMDTIGYAFLDSNSLIKINDMQDKANYAYVFNHTIDYNGALLDSIESPALTETETKYTYTPEEVQKQRRTEIIVDKHEQTITAIIQEQDELNNRQNVFEQDLDSTTNTISSINEDLTEKINQLQVNIDGLSQTVSQKGGDNIFSYDKEFWTGATDDDVSNLEEYTDTDIQQNSVSGVGYIINKGTSRQNVQVKNDIYTISFTYKKLVELATGYVLINGTRYDLTSTNWDEIVVTLDVNTNYVDFGIISDTNNAFEIFDLMGSIGNEKQVWTQNANETRTDTVKIGKGITVSSSLTNTIWKADADGNRIINTDTGETVAEFTDKGTVTKNIEVQETAEIAGILIQEIDNQTWISSLL